MNDFFSSDLGSLIGTKVSGHYCGAKFTGVVFWNDGTGVGVDFDAPVKISTGSVRTSCWMRENERCFLGRTEGRGNFWIDDNGSCDAECCRFSIHCYQL